MSKVINFRDEYGLAPLRTEREPVRVSVLRLLGYAAEQSGMTLGMDVSKWQGAMDFERALEAGARFAFIKASQDTFVDGQYERNINQATMAGMPFGLYHFCDPGYHSAIEQARFFADLAAGELSMVADVERSGGLNPYQLEVWVRDFLGELAALLPGRAVEDYTRISFWDPNIQPGGVWAAKNNLWAARYASWLDGPWGDGKYVPRDWDDWVLWQFSADGNGRGDAFGAESASIDLNYFNGDQAAFERHYGLDSGDPSASPSPGPAAEGWAYRVLVDGLRVRYGPGTSYAILGVLDYGEVVHAIDADAPQEYWVKVALPNGEVGWSAAMYRGGALMERDE